MERETSTLARIAPLVEALVAAALAIGCRAGHESASDAENGGVGTVGAQEDEYACRRFSKPSVEVGVREGDELVQLGDGDWLTVHVERSGGFSARVELLTYGIAAGPNYDNEIHLTLRRGAEILATETKSRLLFSCERELEKGWATNFLSSNLDLVRTVEEVEALHETVATLDVAMLDYFERQVTSSVSLRLRVVNNL